MSTDSPRYRRAFVVLVLLSLAIGALSMLYTAHEVNANNRKFCQVVAPFAATPVPRPTSAAQHGALAAYLWHQRFIQLGKSIGC